MSYKSTHNIFSNLDSSDYSSEISTLNMQRKAVKNCER